MLCLQPGWLPALMGVLLTTGAVLSYIICVLNKTATPYLPFISEAAGHMPQSGIFAIFVFFTAMLSFLTLYVRFSVVKEMLGGSPVKMCVINVLSFFCGILSTTGMLVVAAYPVTSVVWAHNLGAYSIFVFGVIYAFMQTILSYHLYPEFNGLLICHLRLAISILSSCALVIMAVYYALGDNEWDAAMGDKPKDQRMPGDKGFIEYTVSSVAEWMMAILFVLFFFTFIREFKKLAVRMNAQLLVKHLDEDVSLRRVWGHQDHEPFLR